MAYTREMRAANAAKAAAAASAAAEATGAVPIDAPEPAPYTPPEVDTTTRVQLRNDRRTRSEEELHAAHAKRSGIEEPREDVEESEAAPDQTIEKATAPAPDTPTPLPAAETPVPVAHPVPAAPAVEMLTVKVDGESFEVPKADVDEAGGVAAYRMLRAADNRLKKSNEVLAQTQAQHAQTQAIARAIAAQQIPQPPEPTDDDLIQAIRFGTPQEASAALAKVAAKGRGPQIDRTEVVLQATAIGNYNAAKKRFASEFQDLLADPILKQTVTALEQGYIQSLAPGGQPNWSNLSNLDFDDGFRRLGNQVRSAFGRQPQPASVPATPAVAAPTVGNPSPASAKEERKASIVNLPTAAQRATLPEEEKPPTREQILNDELKARGRPPLY